MTSSAQLQLDVVEGTARAPTPRYTRLRVALFVMSGQDEGNPSSLTKEGGRTELPALLEEHEESFQQFLSSARFRAALRATARKWPVGSARQLRGIIPLSGGRALVFTARVLARSHSSPACAEPPEPLNRLLGISLPAQNVLDNSCRFDKIQSHPGQRYATQVLIVLLGASRRYSFLSAARPAYDPNSRS